MYTLPDSLWLYIFSFLSSQLVWGLGSLCQQFYRVSRDKLLWKFFLGKDYQIPDTILNEVSESDSCISQYIRLHDHSPCVVSQVIHEHKDEVLYVAFSHDGKMFCTCSKDSSVKVWEVSAMATLLFDRDMSDFHWKYTQFSQFNSSDTMLLVSGVHTGKNSISGDIVIFSLDDFSILSRQFNKPYDTFGCWYDDSIYLSGNSFWQGGYTSCSALYVSRATQEIFSESTRIHSLIYRLKNENASTVRMLMVANVPVLSDNPEACSDTHIDGQSFGAKKIKFDAERPQVTQKYLVFACGVKTYLPHVVGIKKIDEDFIAKSLSPEGIELPVSNENDEILYDGIDFLIDVEGHIIGTSLSADQRYLYANVRAWAEGCKITDPLSAPPISQEIEVRCYDLCTKSPVPDKCFKSHRAYTNHDDTFLIFLDSSQDYIASGAEDNNGYLWDSQLGCQITQFGHKSVVNSVAFNAVDQEMLVTVSDDQLIKIWRSRRRQRELQKAKCRRILTDSADELSDSG